MGKPNYSQQAYAHHPFLLQLQDLFQQFKTNKDTGLNDQQTREAQQDYGPNKLEGEGGVQWYTILIKQISNAMILVLVLAMALSYGVTDYVEGGVITAVIVLNITIGFYQEFQAEKKMDSLRALSSPSATVLREGGSRTIPSAEVVPGDVIQIKTGDTIPADLRLVEAMNLECDEKILTGEAIPVAKDAKFDASGMDELSTGVGDRLNMLYSSATVTKGRGKGIVVFTAMQTEIGKIAASMQGKTRKANRSISREHSRVQPIKGLALRVWDGVGAFLGLTTGTPLQRKLSKLAYVLFGGAILLAIIVFGVNKFNVTNEVAIYAISTGIAIIPESLIAVLTITMVVGMTQMRKRFVVIRQLSALEALGGVTNICSDKTGTLTRGQMIARKAWIPGCGTYAVLDADEASNPNAGSVAFSATEDHQGDIKATRGGNEEKTSMERPVDKTSELTPDTEKFLESTALCNLAGVRFDEKKDQWQAIGDPTEIALQVFVHRFGFGKKALEEDHGWKQLSEYPFDSTIKRMSVVYQSPTGANWVFTKGAVERVVDLCTGFGFGEHNEDMTKEKKDTVLQKMTDLADQGLRVMAIACRTIDDFPTKSTVEYPRDQIEASLTLLGLAGLYDPPRLETKASVAECTTAGIKVHMLTGDHPSTASAIAKEVGILPSKATISTLSASTSSALVKTAMDFDGMTDDEIDKLPTLPLVIARCSPQTKTRMIAALHRRQGFVAMTGDGVNDAPSLQAADVGIAMGMAGSDVAKGASDIVLADDNFASIVNAIEEGRRMFDNIQKFVLHLLAANVGEVVLLIMGLGFQDEAGISVFPLSPLQILWINMLTSSFPAFGLGREKASSAIMHRPPHDSKKGVFTWQIIVDMFVYGIMIGALTLLSFVIIVYGPGEGELGLDCNRGYSDSCNVVFRARAAVFAELTWLILISAWEFKGLRRSMFGLDPVAAEKRGAKFPFFGDIYENKFLFYAVFIGALSVFPAVYIPVLNTKVFKHKGIGWEWALSVGAVVVYVIGVEAWKACKRYWGFFTSEEEVKEDTLDLRQGESSFAKSLSTTKTECESG